MVREVPVDVVFPVLHGLYGEDGTVQGLLELARIPYVGSGVLASAVSMDKLYTKIIVDALGIRQARYVPLTRAELSDMDRAAGRVEEILPYPVFVKPANAGSSRGVSKAGNRAQLKAALAGAARYDRKILAEEAIAGRELECAVLGGGSRPAEASGVGEILAAAEFYDFDAKYHSAASRTVTDPELPGDAAETIRRDALKIFKAVDGYGLARVDFFLTPEGEVVFNEINTMPGFTAISMYPILWEARGVGKAQLVEKLIAHAKERYGADGQFSSGEGSGANGELSSGEEPVAAGQSVAGEGSAADGRFSFGEGSAAAGKRSSGEEPVAAGQPVTAGEARHG